MRVPDAVQRVAVHRRSGTPVSRGKATGVPVLQRTTPLRFVLRCARDTQCPAQSTLFNPVREALARL